MKRSLFISLSVFATASVTLADSTYNMETGVGQYIAEGISVKWVSGYLQTSRANSTRLYDSRKGAEWAGYYSDGTTKKDHNMCWLHASANTIQYWQSYYGVFAKPQTGSYYNANTGKYETNTIKPLPYGKIGTEAPSSTDASQDPVPDGRRLSVAKDMYLSIPDSEYLPRDMGGVFSWASEWFFRGADKWEKNNGQIIDLSNSGKTPNTGGYYANYFGTGTPFEQNLSYTMVNCEKLEKDSNNIHKSTTGTPFGDTDTATVKELLLQGLGVQNGIQSTKGQIVCLGTTNSSSGNGHVITCYGFTTNDDGSLKSILIADNNNPTEMNSQLSELTIKVQNERMELYNAYGGKYAPSGSGVNYITAISYINTPQVLKDMLAEYSDVANEAQIWNGKDSTWEAQVENVNELPTEATGWDINVDDTAIAEEHQGYYHTYSTDGRAVVFGTEGAANKTITINGTVKTSHITVADAGYVFQKGTDAFIAGATEGENASLSITVGASLSSEVALNLKNLTMESGATLSSSQTVVVTGDFLVKLQAANTYSLRAAAAPSASVDSDLDLSNATSITLNAEVNMNNHNLILSADTPITLRLNEVDGSIIFFTNMKQLSIADGEVTTVVAEGANLTQYFSDITTADGRDLSGYQVIYSSGTLSMTLVPEPTTATLSLLALAALATRRRRK